MDKHVEDRI
jgi:hypothetical protein